MDDAESLLMGRGHEADNGIGTTVFPGLGRAGYVEWRLQDSISVRLIDLRSEQVAERLARQLTDGAARNTPTTVAFMNMRNFVAVQNSPAPDQGLAPSSGTGPRHRSRVSRAAGCGDAAATVPAADCPCRSAGCPAPRPRYRRERGRCPGGRRSRCATRRVPLAETYPPGALRRTMTPPRFRPADRRGFPAPSAAAAAGRCPCPIRGRIEEDLPVCARSAARHLSLIHI